MESTAILRLLFFNSFAVEKYLGSVWFPENARERKLRGKMEGKKKVRKGI